MSRFNLFHVVMIHLAVLHIHRVVDLCVVCVSVRAEGLKQHLTNVLVS